MLTLVETRIGLTTTSKEIARAKKDLPELRSCGFNNVAVLNLRQMNGVGSIINNPLTIPQHISEHLAHSL